MNTNWLHINSCLELRFSFYQSKPIDKQGRYVTLNSNM